jgi:HlyD family secretion protein
VLIVPNAALNFRPRKDQASKPEAGKAMLWVRSQSSDLHAVPVALGATSDSLTQIVSYDVNVGEQVAVGYRSKP